MNLIVIITILYTLLLNLQESLSTASSSNDHRSLGQPPGHVFMSMVSKSVSQSVPIVSRASQRRPLEGESKPRSGKGQQVSLSSTSIQTAESSLVPVESIQSIPADTVSSADADSSHPSSASVPFPADAASYPADTVSFAADSSSSGAIESSSSGSSSSSNRGPKVTVTVSSGNKSSAFECPEQFGYFDDLSDCSKYFVCVFGEALHESCTGGLYFSAELQTCDWPRNVICAHDTLNGKNSSGKL